MRFLLILAFIICEGGINYAGSDSRIVKVPRLEYSRMEQMLFSFVNPLPPQIKLLDRLDLSFYVNQSIVFQYRVKLEVPKGGEALIEKSLINWSSWMISDIANIHIPRFGQVGRYKLVVEYKTHTSNEIRKYERIFDVYPGITGNAALRTTSPSSNTGGNVKAGAKNVTDVSKTANQQVKVTENQKPAVRPGTTAKASGVEQKSGQIAATKDESIEKVAGKDEKKEILIPEETKLAEVNSVRDYDKLLSEALDKHDTAIFRESVVRGADLNIGGTHGGNIFHLMAEKEVIGWKLIKVIKGKGVSLNAVDQFGNTPLQFALLTGESAFAGALIDEGAELNIKNSQNLSALHLAAFLNNKDITEKLLKKGALIDLKGNAGYTPLHIASEMDHLSVAKMLLTGGANGGIKTDQKLTPREIARIQENSEMAELLVKNGSFSATPSNSAPHYSKINSSNKVSRNRF